MRGSAWKAKRQGFTVIELLVAAVMVAILAGVSMPFFLAVVQNYRFDGAVRRMVSDLRYTQSLAVAKGGYYGLHSGSDSSVNLPNSYRIERSSDGTTWPSASDTVSSNPDVITNWFNLADDFQGIAITSIKDGAGASVDRIKFTSRGSLDVVNPSITPPITITLTNSAGETRTIQIRPTGSVKSL